MKEEILGMLTDQRLELLDEVINADEEYRSVRKEQMQIQKQLEAMGLSVEQKEKVQELLTKTNQSSAIYGKIAFKQGFRDGAEFMCELKAKN